MLGHVVRDLQPHGRPESAAGQLALQSLEQILVAVLDVHVGVPGDPEGVLLHDFHPGEQNRQKRRDEVLHRQEPGGVVLGPGGLEPDEPVDVVGHLDPGEALCAVARRTDRDGQVQAQAADEREGMSRIDRQRCQHREHLLGKIRRQFASLGVGEVRPAHDADSLLGQCRSNRVEEDLGVPDRQLPGALADEPQLLPG